MSAERKIDWPRARRLFVENFVIGLVISALVFLVASLTRADTGERAIRASLYAALVPEGVVVDSTLALRSTGRLRLSPLLGELAYDFDLTRNVSQAGDSLAVAFWTSGAMHGERVAWGPTLWTRYDALPEAGEVRRFFACAVRVRGGRSGPPTCVGPWQVRRGLDGWIVRDWRGHIDTLVTRPRVRT